MDLGRLSAAAAAALAPTAAMLCSSPAGHAAPPRPTPGPMVVAHRGGTGDFPENAVLAITKAVQAGVDGVWLTVQARDR